VSGAALHTRTDHPDLANSYGSGLSSSATPTVTLTNQSSGEQFGGSVLIADFNHDGTGDAVVGAALAAGKFGNDARIVFVIGAYLSDKNPANPNDNDGRIVVASIPEGPPPVFLFVALLLPIVARRARTRGRRPVSIK